MTSAARDPRSPVRPYTVTGGRTGTAVAWPPETVIETRTGAPSGGGPVPGPRAPDPGSVGTAELRALADVVRGPVWRPGDAGFDAEIAASYGTLTHRPAVLLGARDRDDVAAAVGFASRHGLTVAVQATGHGAVSPVEGGVLISTRRMRELVVDPERRTARVGAGVVWSEVITAAARHGLAPLCGSAPGVGVAGFTLGGGPSPVARTYGYTADHVVAVEVVTADGRVRQVDARREPDLFWGLRGGKGNLGVVTSLEIELFALTRLWGGGLFFGGASASEVLGAYPAWSAGLPERTTTSVAISRLRGVPGMVGTPPPVVHLRLAHLGDAEEGAALAAPMRAHRPRVDTLADMPFTAVGTIHDDPTEPATVWKRGLLLSGLPEGAVAALLRATGPDAADPVASVELRHLGGALARRPDPDNAVGGRGAAYGLFAVDALERDGSAPPRGLRLVDELAPYATGGAALNFLGTVTDSDVIATAWDTASYRRLVELKGRHDPTNLFRHGYAVPAGPGPARAVPPAPDGPEARAILELCRPWRSVAEVAATLRLPIGVVRVLVTDLVSAGLADVHRPPGDEGPDTDELERVLRGLRNRY